MSALSGGDTGFLLASAGDDIKLWDCAVPITASSFSLLKHFNPHSSTVTSLQWSRDNNFCASASEIGDKICVTYCNAGDQHISLAEGEGKTCVALNSSSHYLLAGGKDGRLDVWDLKTRKVTKSFKAHMSAVTSLLFNSADTVIASGSATGEIVITNAVSGIAYTPLLAPNVHAVRQLLFSSFKKSLLASATDAGSVYLWDTGTRKLIHSYENSHCSPTTGITFSPLNQMLMMSVGLDKNIVCYDVTSKKIVKSMSTSDPLTSVDLLYDGITLAVGSTQGKIYIYDLRSITTPVLAIGAHRSAVLTLRFQSHRAKEINSGNRASQKTLLAAPGVIADGNFNYRHHSDPVSNGVTASGDVGYNSDKMSRLSANVNEDCSSNLVGEDIYNANDIFSPLRDDYQNDQTRHPFNVAGTLTVMKTDHSRMPMSSSSASEDYADGIFSPVAQGTNNAYHNNTSPAASLLPHVRLSRGSMSPLVGTSKEVLFSKSPAHVAAMYLQADQNSTNSPIANPPPVIKYESTDDQDLQQIPLSASSSKLKRASASPPKNKFPVQKTENNHHEAFNASVLSTVCDSSVNNVEHVGVAMGLSTKNVPISAQESSSGANIAPSSFQTNFIMSLVREEIEEFRDEMRRDVLNLHMDMLKQFQQQQAEIRLMLQEYSINDKLALEIQRLREENERLKKTY